MSLLEEIDIPSSPNLGYVYLMINWRNRYTKIGFTKNKPIIRERTLQSEEPEVEVVFLIPGSMEEERRLHQKYAHRRLRGEWFSLTEEERFQIVSDEFDRVSGSGSADRKLVELGMSRENFK